MENEKDIFVGKITFANIRKAYFDKKLEEVLNKIQGEEELTEAKVKILYSFLEKLQSEETGQVKILLDTFGGKVIEKKPPSVEELRAGAEYSKEEEDKAKQVVAYIEKTFTNTREMVNKKANIPPSYWLDTSATILSYEPILFAYYIFKRQLYFARLANIIDETGVSRLEAENRAKLTKEYAEFKNLQNLIGDGNKSGLIERFENLSKKYDKHN